MEFLKKKNTQCTIKDSALCNWVHKEDCANCYVMELSNDEQADALKRWEVTQSLLPDDVDALHQSETCLFCVKDPLPRSCYATLDIANPEPESKKGMFFGIGKKVRSRIGSLIPLAISCCSRCRKVFFMADAIRYTTPLVFLVIGILLTLIPPVHSLLNAAGALMSTLFVVAMFLIGILAGRVFFNLYVKNKGREVRLNVFDIPIVAKMQDMGWFLLEGEGPVTKLIFSKNKMKQANLKTIDFENKQ